MSFPPFRFADRDLMMRFRGGGVGHTGKSTRQATDFFKKDRHILDVQTSFEQTSDIVVEELQVEERNDLDSELERMERSTESDAASDEELEDDCGYRLGEDQSNSEEEESSEDSDELGDGDLGPEDDGRAVDPRYGGTRLRRAVVLTNLEYIEFYIS